MSADRHVRFRELLAERLDAPLVASDAADLETHLAACLGCRVVDRDYAAQREQLGALSAIEPPRDLWARTRAAIDHEVAREGGRPFAARALEFDQPGARRQLRVAIGSLLSVALVLLLVGGPLAQAPIREAASATPFSIPSQDLAFLDIADGQSTLYRSNVAEVCPPPRLDCATGPEGREVVRLGSGVAARELALGDNGQLFIAGRDQLGAEVFAIVALPPGASPEPSPTPALTPGASVTPTPSEPTATEPVVEPTDGPDPTPGDGSAEPTITPPPPPGQPDTAEAYPILSGVRGTGAPAAWSPDGTILALSAMPADGSAGSDVYTWRPGDLAAAPLTIDHRSTFASWDGSRVVVSRVAPAEGTDADTTRLAVTTVVIDPTSGEERHAELADAWLPSVDPTRHWVVFWMGRLEAQEAAVIPAGGRLFIADWSAIDPWAADDAAAEEPSAPPSTEPGGGPGAGDAPSPSPEPAATIVPDPSPIDAGGADETPGRGTPGAGPTEVAGATPSPSGPGQPRAISGRTNDWVVRWSAAGTAFGIWTGVETRAPGSGTLIVRAVPDAAQPDGVVLVAPTPAQRSFTVGADRVAWVAPLPNGDGELWVASWGERGNGSLRLQRLDSAEALPVF